MATIVLTGSTCGDACWSAVEDICRCSCYGANHGAKRDGRIVERTRRSEDYFYVLAGVGGDAPSIREIERAYTTCTCEHYYDHGGVNSCDGRRWGWFNGNMRGVPAFTQLASAGQIARWPELAHLRGCEDRDRPYLLWVRDDMRDLIPAQ